MTTFPKKPADRIAATIRGVMTTTKIHAQKITTLESQNAQNQAIIAAQATTIAAQGSTITDQGVTLTGLTATVGALLSGDITIGGNLTVDGSQIVLDGQTLTSSQLGFLIQLNQMATVSHPTGGDLTSTNTQLDDLLNELGAQGYMT